MHEIKHDGYRLQIHLRDGRVRLFTRTGVDWSDRYPWIVEDAARLPVKHAIIDAECCCADEDGLTDFDALHHASTIMRPSLIPSICSWLMTPTFGAFRW